MCANGDRHPHRRATLATGKGHDALPLWLDGWALHDLRALPPDLMDWLAVLLGVVGRTGKWPGALTHAHIALVPKEGPPRALNARPLTVLSILYRL